MKNLKRLYGEGAEVSWSASFESLTVGYPYIAYGSATPKTLRELTYWETWLSAHMLREGITHKFN